MAITGQSFQKSSAAAARILSVQKAQLGYDRFKGNLDAHLLSLLLGLSTSSVCMSGLGYSLLRGVVLQENEQMGKRSLIMATLVTIVIAFLGALIIRTVFQAAAITVFMLVLTSPEQCAHHPTLGTAFQLTVRVWEEAQPGVIASMGIDTSLWDVTAPSTAEVQGASGLATAEALPVEHIIPPTAAATDTA
jgi:hypothetical protein